MNPLDLKRVSDFVNQNIGEFHKRRLEKVTTLKLNDVLRRKNPYLFRAKTHNALFEAQKIAVYQQFTDTFMNEFCDPDGQIDWNKLVQFNSG